MAKKASRVLTIGIQGGAGSFNEEAIHSYCKEKGINSYAIKYLYTTRNVLKALHEKKIDRGLFAVQNSIGGTVMETINALSEYNCRIIDSHKIIVRHCLLSHPRASVSTLKSIMSHPQALEQCKKTLARKYPRLKLLTGEKNLVDQATAAKGLSEGKVPKTVGVLAPRICADLFGLTVVACGLQDKKKNYTTFLFVSRFNGQENKHIPMV